MLNVKELEAFRAFIECGSVTLAADRLGRTQPQVGRLLTSLEESLGFALFSRSGKRLRATPEGWRFYKEVDRVMGELQSLSRSAEQIRSGSSDHVRILTAPHVTKALVAPALSSVAREIPNLTAEVASRVRLDIETWITQEQFDIGVGILPLDSPAVESEPFLRTSVVVVMAATHPLTRLKVIQPKHLYDTALVATHSRSLLRQSLDRMFREEKRKPDIRFEATNGLIACELAAQGLGVALADPFVALSSGASGLAMKRLSVKIPLEYGFLYPVGKSRSFAVRRLAEAVVRTARDRLPEIGVPASDFEFI
ncbi:LysR family transcriptional regulator [Paraburkholderia sp. 22099]|uniref:LysR family transcriptional regulator n=1 Tax=Paraburkholderia TaxID=1822464 RepID=UPI00285AD3D2|nr:LysR family transcriptional regulator [Paraburkholderia terricola]MDR6494645.1 DNA-binding transcriptional LysR family regulator [Paraburkholderia terricola]